MTDCTEYGEQELSLMVMNEEYCYNDLQKAIGYCLTFKEYVINCIDTLFIYTDEQLEDLEQTYNEEIMEYYEE